MLRYDYQAVHSIVFCILIVIFSFLFYLIKLIFIYTWFPLARDDLDFTLFFTHSVILIALLHDSSTSKATITMPYCAEFCSLSGLTFKLKA